MNGSPASSVGRGMKVGQGGVDGPCWPPSSSSWTAVTRTTTRRWRADAELIVAGLEGIEDVRATVDDGDQLFFPGGVPRVRIELLGDPHRGTPTLRRSPRRRAQYLHGRLGRRHVRRPHDPCSPARPNRSPAGLSDVLTRILKRQPASKLILRRVPVACANRISVVVDGHVRPPSSRAMTRLGRVHPLGELLLRQSRSLASQNHRTSYLELRTEFFIGAQVLRIAAPLLV